MKFVLGMYATAPFAMLALDTWQQAGPWLVLAGIAIFAGIAGGIWLLLTPFRSKDHRDWLESEVRREALRRAAERETRRERLERKRRRWPIGSSCWRVAGDSRRTR